MADEQAGGTAVANPPIKTVDAKGKFTKSPPLAAPLVLKTQPPHDPATHDGVVHYVLHDGPSKGQHRVAVISFVRQDVNPEEHPGCCNLHVFPVTPNDGIGHITSLGFFMSRDYDPAGALGTWHYIEGSEAAK